MIYLFKIKDSVVTKIGMSQLLYLRILLEVHYN